MSAYTNIYELLDQEGEEGVPRVAPVKKDTPVAKSAPAKGSSSAPAKSAQQSSFNKTQNPKDNQRRGERSEGRGGIRQDNRAPRQQRDGQGYNNAPRSSGFGGEGESDVQPVETARRDRPADRYQAREQGSTRHDDAKRGAPAGGYVGTKRVYDRKSATGRGNSLGREDKRRGGGRGNWGANDGSDEVQAAADETATAVDGEAAPSVEGVHGAEKTEEETEEQKARREEREKEDKLLSFSDYQKQREAKRTQSSVLSSNLNVRKANEGVDEKTAKKWSSMEQVKKAEAPAAATTATSAATKTEGETQSKTSKKGKAVPLDQLFNVTVKESQPRPQYDDDRRGGRGGRGRGDSGFRGGRGGQRGDRAPRQDRSERQPRGAEVNFDPNSFPTLQ